MPPMIFGGKLLSEMDICAAMTTRRFLYASNEAKDAVTVAVKNVSFFVGAVIGDLIYLEGEVVRTGSTSIDIHVVGYREKHPVLGEEIKRQKICEGDFRFCSCTPPKLGVVGPVPHKLFVEPKQEDVFKVRHEN